MSKCSPRSRCVPDAHFLRDQQCVIAAGCGDSKLEIDSFVGHGVHWETPERFAADLLSFIESLGGPLYGTSTSAK